MGLLGVVVGNVDPKNPLQMSAVEHERPVEALGPDGPDPSFGEGVRPRSLDRSVDDLDALACEHRVEAGGVLRVLVPDQEPEDAAAGEIEGQVPPCWVTQAASGFLVAPATWTRLVWSSITKTTYRVLSQMGSTVKKSVATIPSASLPRNSPRSAPTAVEQDPARFDASASGSPSPRL